MYYLGRNIHNRTLHTMDKVPVTAIVLTRNESSNIERCLKSCSFAKELLIVDDNSSDDTVEKATALGARVLHRSLNGDWGAQKTFGIDNAMNPWVLIIDADEQVSPQLATEICSVVKKNSPFCYWIKRENYYHSGKKAHGALRSDWVARLTPKENAKFSGAVHESLETPYDEKKLSGHLIHFPYKDIHSYFKKMDIYSTLSAEKYLLQGKKFNFLCDIIVRPFWAFFKTYFINLGILDGKIGWILSVYYSWYTMTKYVKFYLKKYHGDHI